MAARDQSRSGISLVIQKYMEGKSMDRIVKEAKISKGKVHYIINDWKNKLGTASADEIIDFTRLVKRSGITIEQCAEGFRMINILKELKVEYGDIADGENHDNDNTSNNNNGLIFFIKQIYTNCKKLDIPPDIIPSWIKNLLDFQSYITIDNTEGQQDQYNNLIQESYIQKKDKKNPNETNTSIDIRQADLNPILGNGKSYQAIDHPASDLNFNQTTTTDSSSFEIKIPFISQVSFFISQKKKELESLAENQKNIEKNMQTLKQQENRITENINKLIQNEKLAFSYLKLFSKLEQSLKENYSINIREDIQSFSQLINDFKDKGYDAEDIIQEYLRSLSLKLELITNENRVRDLQTQIGQLTSQASILESQINQHRLTLGRYTQLEAMGFGLNELRLLWDLVGEISGANEISNQQAVSKFLKDIEEQYDSKVGFEKKVDEKRGKLAQINRELANSRQNLLVNPLVGPSLSNLLLKGIGEQDIVNINHLVEICTTSGIDFPNHNIDSASSSSQNIKDKDTAKRIIVNSRSEYWSSLIEELKKYENIKVAIKKQHENHDKLQKQLNHLEQQKQAILSYLQIAISFINEINNRIYYSKGFVDKFNKDLNYRNGNMLPSFSNPLIFIINNNNDNIKKDRKDNTGKGKENQEEEEEKI
jgi:hypothetical protein